jgi:cysteinyl-tRNA synthetase
LLRNGKAYPAGGNVYLDAAAMQSFGSMARMTRQDLSDCRLDISPAKKSPQDILLWNSSEHFDVSFSDSVLGTGIPWWHMQDSSVAVASFGGSYDIHGGASELVYPHHESHLAQLKAITSLGRPVRFWTHVGLVRIKGKKMSKSLGNTIEIQDLLRKYSANAIRLYLLSKHYRDEFDFSEKELERFEELCFKISSTVPDNHERKKQSSLAAKFFKCMEDDFDTPGAIKALTEAAKSGNNTSDLKAMVNILGLYYY